MSVRNDCRIELKFRPRALDWVQFVDLDLCFGVGDGVTAHRGVFATFLGFGQHLVGDVRYDLFKDAVQRFQLHVLRHGVEDPPVPFYLPDVGVRSLPLSMLDQIIGGPDGPQRSHWRIDLPAPGQLVDWVVPVDDH